MIKFGEVFLIKQNHKMKNLTFIGIILLAVSVLLFYLTSQNFLLSELKLSHLMGILAGVGIGLIIGGIVGYASKGSNIRAEKQRREYAQLQKEKNALEIQAAELANNQRVETETTEQKNMQNRF